MSEPMTLLQTPVPKDKGREKTFVAKVHASQGLCLMMEKPEKQLEIGKLTVIWKDFRTPGRLL